MFGWFKILIGKRETQRFTGIARNPQEASEAMRKVMANARLIQGPEHSFVSGDGIGPVRVLSSDFLKAVGLIHNIETLKRNKKKHSHLLAELKALEVK